MRFAVRFTSHWCGNCRRKLGLYRSWSLTQYVHMDDYRYFCTPWDWRRPFARRRHTATEPILNRWELADGIVEPGPSGGDDRQGSVRPNRVLGKNRAHPGRIDLGDYSYRRRR